MLIANPRQPLPAPFSATLIAMILLWIQTPVSGFVFLDTSGPNMHAPQPDTARKDSLPVPTAVPTAKAPEGFRPSVAPKEIGHPGVPPAGKERAPGHYGNVLFLSADSKLVYAYVGVLKALDEYGLQPDAVLAESKAVVVGAAWALGYDAAGLEKELLHKPLEAYLRPFPALDQSGRRFLPFGPDPLQWEISLGLQSLQTSGSKWNDVRVGEGGEYLHLSWLAARLTHDAPNGPVEDLSETPRHLAVQVSDLNTDKPAVLSEGNLQWILKGSLLPADVVRQRPRLWPYASGSLLSGHTAMAENLPFTCDRFIMVKPGHRLRPPALESAPLSWGDSLQLHAKRMAAESEDRNGSVVGGGQVMVIDLEPEGEFDPEESDPQMWISLGYTSALRSMDILRSVLAKGKETAADPDLPSEEGKLGLNRLSVNPLASGGRQLLLDILQNPGSGQGDGGSEEAISALVESGYYTDLDLDWSKATREDKALLIFDAKEQSKILFRAGYNYTYTGEELTDRSPEGYAGLAWSEPFYIPFRAEAAVLLGGHRPGYEGRALIAPAYPLHMELGVTRTHWEMYFPFTATVPAQKLGADNIRLNRTLSEVFLTVFPIPSAYLRTAIQKHEMDLPSAFDEGEPSFLSTDFQETAFLGLGNKQGTGAYPHSLRIVYRNLNRVNTAGQVRYATSNIESRLRLGLGNFRFTDQYYWSDEKTDVSDPYDIMETGRIDAFTFQNEYFLRFLRSQNFQDFKIEYAPVFGKAGLRLIAGAYRNYGPLLYAEQADYKTFGGGKIPYRVHWEAQAGYLTPLGAVRAGMGGFEEERPFYFFRIGTGFELGFDKDE